MKEQLLDVVRRSETPKVCYYASNNCVGQQITINHINMFQDCVHNSCFIFRWFVILSLTLWNNEE